MLTVPAGGRVGVANIPACTVAWPAGAVIPAAGVLRNVASAMRVSGDNIEAIRLAVNGAAARPLRLKAVEDAVRGKAATPATGEMAGKLAVQGAVPLQFNAYKIPLMRNLVKRAIGGVEEAKWAS